MGLHDTFGTELAGERAFQTEAGKRFGSYRPWLGGEILLTRTADWRRGTESLEERRLLSLFADDPGAPFSIHRFVSHGASACGKHPGEWFGPSATASCIK